MLTQHCVKDMVQVQQPPTPRPHRPTRLHHCHSVSQPHLHVHHVFKVVESPNCSPKGQCQDKHHQQNSAWQLISFYTRETLKNLNHLCKSGLVHDTRHMVYGGRWMSIISF